MPVGQLEQAPASPREYVPAVQLEQLEAVASLNDPAEQGVHNALAAPLEYLPAWQLEQALSVISVT